MTHDASGRQHPVERSRPRSTQTDARIQRSRDAVLATTFELLYESGVGGFSIDEVARRSGVAKTTVYRHWPSREALVLDACSQIAADQEVPDTGSLEADLRAILTNIAVLLQTANWASILPSIIDLAEREPEFADVHRRIQHGHAAPLREVLHRGIRSGTLPAKVDVAAITAALLGPLFYRRWFSREPIDDAFVEKIISGALAAGTTTGAGST